MKKYLIFALKSQTFAMPLEEIMEIIPVKTLYRTKEDGLSVVFWNQYAVPVIEPLVLRNLPPSRIRIETRIAVLKKNDCVFGIMIDKILGIMEINSNEIEEENINDMGYSEGVYQRNIKIIRLSAFLTKQKVEIFKQIYLLNENDMEEIRKSVGIEAIGQEKVIQEITIQTLNWIIYANQKQIPEELLLAMLNIHDLVKRL